MPAAVAADATIWRKRQIILVAVFLPIVWNFERVSRSLKRRIIARWRLRLRNRPSVGGPARRSLLHDREIPHFALRGFKLLRIASCVRWNSAKFLDFLIYSLHAMIRTRVVRKKLRRIFAFGVRFQFLKKLRHRPRVVARIVQNLCAADVCLRFRGTRVAQKHSARGKRPKLLHQRPADAAAKQSTDDTKSALR